MSSPSPQAIITALGHLRVVAYFNCVGTAMLIYDYFLTLPREIDLIWRSPWTLIKVLFLITRYLPFADVAVHLFYHFQQHPSSEACYTNFVASSWLFYVGVGSAELILTLRTWAVWNRDLRLSIGLPLFFAMYNGLTAIFIVKFLKSVAFLPLASPAMLGCIAIKGSHIISVCWTLLLIYEGGIFLLMLIKGVKTYNSGGSSGLFRVVYRDGLLYYMYLFAFSLANVIVVATVPSDLQVVLVLSERVLHPILACRVIIDIRGQVMNKSSSALVNTFSSAPKPKFAFMNHVDTATSASGQGSFLHDI